MSGLQHRACITFNEDHLIIVETGSHNFTSQLKLTCVHSAAEEGAIPWIRAKGDEMGAGPKSLAQIKKTHENWLVVLCNSYFPWYLDVFGALVGWLTSIFQGLKQHQPENHAEAIAR